ncbi:MAG: hypothetical protein ACI9N3_000355 [Colwellia sp.]|jgi:hypothetical protein
MLSSLREQYKKSNVDLYSEVLKGDLAEVLHDKTKTEHANMLLITDEDVRVCLKLLLAVSLINLLTLLVYLSCQ